MSNTLGIIRVIKDLDPIVAALIVAVLIIGSYNGWEFFSKKKSNKEITNKLMLIWSRLFELANHKSRIIYHDILADQMRVVEVRLDECTRILQDVYFDLKKELGYSAAELVGHPSIKTYRLILRIAREDIKTSVRAILQENHLIDKSEIELQQHIRQQYEQVSRQLTDILNELHEDKDVPRDQLYRVNQAQNHRLFEIFSSIIRSCRDIAIRYEGEVRQIEKQVKTILEKGEIGDTDGVT